jgi:hypothetical protein
VDLVPSRVATNFSRPASTVAFDPAIAATQFALHGCLLRVVLP